MTRSDHTKHVLESMARQRAEQDQRFILQVAGLKKARGGAAKGTCMSSTMTEDLQSCRSLSSSTNFEADHPHKRSSTMSSSLHHVKPKLPPGLTACREQLPSVMHEVTMRKSTSPIQQFVGGPGQHEASRCSWSTKSGDLGPSSKESTRTSQQGDGSTSRLSCHHNTQDSRSCSGHQPHMASLGLYNHSCPPVRIQAARASSPDTARALTVLPWGPVQEHDELIEVDTLHSTHLHASQISKGTSTLPDGASTPQLSGHQPESHTDDRHASRPPLSAPMCFTATRGKQTPSPPSQPCGSPPIAVIHRPKVMPSQTSFYVEWATRSLVSPQTSDIEAMDNPQQHGGAGKKVLPSSLMWFQQTYPHSRSPTREDTEALRDWLHQQAAILHGQVQQGAADAMGCPSLAVEQWISQGLQCSDEGLVLVKQGKEEFADLGILQAHEQLFSQCFDQACRQVSVGCAGRGHLLAILWAGMRRLLVETTREREILRSGVAELDQQREALHTEVSQLRRQLKDDSVGLAVVNEHLGARLAEQKEEIRQWRRRCEELQSEVEALSAHKDLVQVVKELKERCSQHEEREILLRQEIGALKAQLKEAKENTVDVEDRFSRQAEDLRQMQSEIRCMTPRPPRDLGPLSGMLSPSECQLVQQAVLDGVEPEDIHRLLLGLSTIGRDITPWGTLMGSCSELIKSKPGGIDTLRALLSSRDAPGLIKFLPESVMEQVARAVHHEVDEGSILGLLDGTCCSSTRRDLTPYKDVLGVLARRYGQGLQELGGPITEALRAAKMSTHDRLKEALDQKTTLQREVGKLKRTVAEQHKGEAMRLEQALKDHERKFARRGNRPLTLMEKFLHTKWGDYFMGLGTGEDIPRILRTAGQVNNKRMSKLEAERLIRQILATKEEYEAEQRSPLTLAEYCYIFLEKRYFAIPRLINEVGYNLIYSLGQHAYDADCNLFLRIFTGEVEEEVRREQAKTQRDVVQMMEMVDRAVNKQVTGWLNKQDLKAALKGYFRLKSPDRMQELFEALDQDEEGDAVHYNKLFEDDGSMDQGTFAETLRAQLLAERLEFLQEIEDSLRDIAETKGTTDLTPTMLRDALKTAHPDAGDEVLQEYVERAFGQQVDTTARNCPTLSLGAVVKAIRRGRLQSNPENVALAVKAIAAVGVFKSKLTKALQQSHSKSGGSSGVRNKRELTKRVSFLRALEAVRQKWIKEEEEREVASRAPSVVVPATSPRSLLARSRSPRSSLRLRVSTPSGPETSNVPGSPLTPQRSSSLKSKLQTLTQEGNKDALTEPDLVSATWSGQRAVSFLDLSPHRPVPPLTECPGATSEPPSEGKAARSSAASDAGGTADVQNCSTGEESLLVNRASLSVVIDPSSPSTPDALSSPGCQSGPSIAFHSFTLEGLEDIVASPISAGKRRALMMRSLSKHQTVEHLEEVMMSLAAGELQDD